MSRPLNDKIFTLLTPLFMLSLSLSFSLCLCLCVCVCLRLPYLAPSEAGTFLTPLSSHSQILPALMPAPLTTTTVPSPWATSQNKHARLLCSVYTRAQHQQTIPSAPLSSPPSLPATSSETIWGMIGRTRYSCSRLAYRTRTENVNLCWNFISGYLNYEWELLWLHKV